MKEEQMSLSDICNVYSRPFKVGFASGYCSSDLGIQYKLVCQRLTVWYTLSVCLRFSARVRSMLSWRRHVAVVASGLRIKDAEGWHMWQVMTSVISPCMLSSDFLRSFRHFEAFPMQHFTSQERDRAAALVEGYEATLRSFLCRLQTR